MTDAQKVKNLIQFGLEYYEVLCQKDSTLEDTLDSMFDSLIKHLPSTKYLDIKNTLKVVYASGGCMSLDRLLLTEFKNIPFSRVLDITEQIMTSAKDVNFSKPYSEIINSFAKIPKNVDEMAYVIFTVGRLYEKRRN